MIEAEISYFWELKMEILVAKNKEILKDLLYCMEIEEAKKKSGSAQLASPSKGCVCVVPINPQMLVLFACSRVCVPFDSLISQGQCRTCPKWPSVPTQSTEDEEPIGDTKTSGRQVNE